MLYALCSSEEVCGFWDPWLYLWKDTGEKPTFKFHKKISAYYQEMSQSQIADQPTGPRGREAEH